MKTLAAFIIILLALPVGADVLHTVGIARSNDGNEIRYIEHHQYFDDGRHQIRYFDRTLNLIAYKNLKYSDSPLQPSIDQKDLTTNTQIRIEPTAGKVQQTIIRDNVKETFSMPLKASTVIDAGFDAFIRSAWDELTDNSKPTFFEFAIAGRDMTIPMRVKPMKDSAVQDGRTGFVVEPKNWFVRQIVPEIRLQYNGQKRLARYEGFSNIAPEKGADRTVSITFQHYSLNQALDKPLTDWISSASTPETKG